MTLSLPQSLVGFPASARSNIITSLPSLLSGVNTLADWVREARADKLAFRAAVHEHERSSTSNPPSSRPVLPSAGRGGGRSRRRAGRRPLASGKGGMNPTNSADLQVKPPSLFNVPSRIPRNLQKQVVWDVIKINAQVNFPTTGGLAEFNSSFALSSHPQVTNWQALYDQFSIPQASVEFDSLLPPGSTANPGILYIALDFDSTASVGSIAAIEDFSTCEVVPMTAQMRHLRSVHPTVRSTTSSGNNLINKSMWIDTAAPTTLFFGIRALVNQIPTAYTINVTTTIWFCFRNQI
jgi:hypothetical protein